MRKILYGLLEGLTGTIEVPEPIVEFGSLRVERQAHLPAVRSMFPGRAFSGADMNVGLGVDQLQNLHELGIRDHAIGTAILLDTIEHVERPPDAMRELRRCLRPDGLVLISSHFFFPIHQFPADYWRFTAQGVEALLAPFPRARASEAGLRLFPHTVVGVGGGEQVGEHAWQRLTGAVDDWCRHGARTWKEQVLNVLPPVLSQRAYARYARDDDAFGSPLVVRSRGEGPVSTRSSENADGRVEDATIEGKRAPQYRRG